MKGRFFSDWLWPKIQVNADRNFETNVSMHIAQIACNERTHNCRVSILLYAVFHPMSGVSAPVPACRCHVMQ